MKNLIFLVCCALVIKSSWCDGISIVGSKFVRPNRKYTVAVANPLNTAVKLKLLLKCNEFNEENTLQLGKTSGKNVEFLVPEIATGCTFSANNDDGDVVVNHKVDLETPEKTVSIFVQTDKPVYKPRDELRFRVIVVDIEMKPVTIKAIDVLLMDASGDSVRHWTFAKLDKGIFETSYRMTADKNLGTWSIVVTVNDGSISNEKTQSFEVMEYVLPKFAVKAWPTKTLLIEEKKISLNVESRYTFGQPVEGKVQVKLYLKKYSERESYKKDEYINEKAVVKFKINEELEVIDGEDYALVNMTVAVTDAITNETVSITQHIPVYSKPYKISLVKPSLYYRPKSDYHFKVSVKDHSGLPVEKGQTIKISIDDYEMSKELDDQGLASFFYKTPDEEDLLTVSATFDDVHYEEIGTIQGLESSGKQYLQIKTTNNRFKISKQYTFSIKSNDWLTQLTYFVVTRGSIVEFKQLKFIKKKLYPLKFKLTEKMAPKATLVVFFIKDRHMIADFIDLNFESFSNPFTFSLNKNDDEPYRMDEEIFVEGTAQKDSTIFFHVIDESALLLKQTEYGLTKQGVLNDLKEYTGKEMENALDWFNSMGLFFKSDAVDDDEVGSSRAKRSPFYYQQRQRRVQNAVLLRLDFPEAWLWRNCTMNKQNKKAFEIQDFVPDTLTSWYVTAFALSPSQGLGIMEYPRKFTVGKPFYIIAHLPYSIKRDEVALIQVTLYNFLGNKVTTDVTLFNKNDEIEFLDKSSSDASQRSKAIILPSNQVKSVSFLIKAKKLGEIAIKIEAVNALTSDGLEHLLRVTPESRLQQENHNRFIDLPDHRTQHLNISCDIPRHADPGSIKIEATIDHDLVGVPAEHQESILKIPNGCGDINLLTLVPNIVALDFLSSITYPLKKDADETVKQKAIDYLKKGYDNQLKYKSSNGAFRQWINETSKESIFLTALVTNTFITASKYITVDRAVIKDAFSWLASKQNSDGCFEEIGEVVYSPMQDSSVALTAFVVAAIKENQFFSSENGSLVEKAVKCLEDKFYSLNSDYHRALATYALSLANHTKRDQYLNKLVEYSIKSTDQKERFWDEGSLSVEIAGYALMSYIVQNSPLDGKPIFEWLSRQRYSSGEFAGVQSTFVGLKAMSKMAQILSPTQVYYRVLIKSKSKSNSNEVTQKWNFDIHKGNALNVTRQDLPEHVRALEIELSGRGFGMFQVSCQYNLNLASAKQRFKIKTELLPGSNHEVQKLKVCVNFIQFEAYARSNKAVVEIFLPSGLVANDAAVEDLVDDRDLKIKNIIRATDGSAVYVYYNSLGTNPVCFKVTAYRQFKIAMHRPAYIVVYDTEDRERFGIETYEGHVLQPCDICENEDCSALKC